MHEGPKNYIKKKKTFEFRNEMQCLLGSTKGVALLACCLQTTSSFKHSLNIVAFKRLLIQFIITSLPSINKHIDGARDGGFGRKNFFQNKS
jgi:hypothetical protein